MSNLINIGAQHYSTPIDLEDHGYCQCIEINEMQAPSISKKCSLMKQCDNVNLDLSL